MPLGSRTYVRLASSLALVASASLCASPSFAGPVADENAKPGLASWVAANDGTARFSGVVDLYPAAWSIAAGEPLRLKVRSTTGYRVEIFRLGWYAGAGQRLIAQQDGLAASPQPYPTADDKYGMAEAKWSDSVTIATDGSWTSGLYVARATQSGGAQATTLFTVRDDGAASRQPILMIVGLNTHQAYNCWPGPTRGGKSLYGFNSSATHPSESITGLTQAVQVSYDRPFFVGGGTADVSQYEYPYVRWLEKSGYEVAYAVDADLQRDPAIAKGRKVVTFAGHEEYTTFEMFDAALAARDAGSNFLFLTGDTWSWQVRLEPGAAGPLSTMVGYKESWVHDPMQKAGYALRTKGDYTGAAAKFARVSRGWKNLENDPTTGIDVRRPGMILTGVQSAGIIRGPGGVPTDASSYPWADLVVSDASFWIYDGTGVHGGDRIPGVFGYEVDSTLASSSDFDLWRKPGQRAFGAIRQVSDGAVKGSSAWYRTDAGAEVVAFGAIFTSWALDDWAARASGHSGTQSATFQRMVKNALDRWLAASPPPPPPPSDGGVYDAGAIADADPVEKDGGTYVEAGPEPAGDASLGDAGASSAPITPESNTSGPTTMAGSGCNAGRVGAAGLAWTALTAALVAALRRRRSRS
jgi:hypothetical protein